MKTILFFGRETFDPGIYSKIFTVDQSVPTPAGDNTLVILGEAPNGVELGKAVQASSSLADNKALFGDKNPIVQAIALAQSSSLEVESAQHILAYNVRALVQASGVIQSSGAVDAITCKPKIYGTNGNSVKITQVTTSTLPNVKVEASWMPTIDKDIDNPLFDITNVTALSTFTTTAVHVDVFDGTASHLFTFTDYPTLGPMLQAIRDAIPTSVVTKDVTTSDNTDTLNLFDIVSAVDITTVKTVKGDLKQLFDFLDLEVSDIEVTREVTATDMPVDFVLQLSGGSAGADPTATDWTNLLAKLTEAELGAMVPILDGLAAPYDSTLNKAVNALVASHTVNQAAVEKRGKKFQAYLPHYGGAGYSGVTEAGTDVDTTVADSGAYNHQLIEFIGFGLDDRDTEGIEHSFIPSYYAVKKASMAMGGPAARVLTGIGINCVKATNDFDESDRKKLHKASVVFPKTDKNNRTFVHMSYTSWKSDDDPNLTIPSRVRCSILSDNDLARKLESKKLEWARSGVAPFISQIQTFIKRILTSHTQSAVNWLVSFGAITVTITGTQFDYEVDDLVVPAIPEYGYGQTTFVSS